MLNRQRKGIVRSMLAQGTLAALLGMTLGCGGSSPAGPTPTPVTPVVPAPVAPIGVYTVTAGTNTVAPGGQLSVSWTASTGRPKDWIGLFKVGDWNGAHGWSSYTAGATSGTFTLSAPTEAGQYEFRYLLDDGVSDAARSGLVTVAPVTPIGVYTVTAGTNTVAPGGQLTMSWVAPSGRGCSGGGDWVALFRVGDPDSTGAANGHSDLWYVHLCGATSGTSALSAPTQPGQYEFRYMVESTAVARSSPVTVAAGPG